MDEQQAVIRINDLTFTYPGAEEPALRNVSLSIDKGDFVAIIGGNGSAKSTLCKTMNGLIPHFYTGDYAGEVTIAGLRTGEHSVSELSRHVGYVYQDFENQLVRPTVLDDASFVPLNYGMRDYKERGMQALAMVGLDASPREFIWQLSGGQKHLLALAGAVSLGPDILIVDEPIAQLDPCHAREIYELLQRFNEQHGMTIIVIEHHTEFVADYCKHVVLMAGGRLVWKKPVHEALNQVGELLRHDVFPPQVTQAAHRMHGSHGKLPVTLEEAELYFSPVEGKAPAAGDVLAVPELIRRDQPVVTAEAASFSYKTVERGKKPVLREVTLSFYPGEQVALVGNNGAGKSSLLRLITGVTKPESGSVHVKGIDTLRTSPESLADLVTYIYQNPEDMFIEDSIRKDVEFFLKARKVENYQEKVDRILASFNLTGLQERDGRLLSGGQQRRASLAIGVAMDPSIILLDEPTASLDIATRKDIVSMLTEVRRHVDTVIIATHDMQLVAEWASRIIVMHEGQVIHDGTRESVFGDPYLLAQAGLTAPQIVELSRRMGMQPLCYTVEEFAARCRAGQEEGVAVNGAGAQAIG
ncbi:ABC transporter ATP-binding protein [Paenibacillus tarimensis]|uniref:ABC transporter ATP-binding protein n=1 Tax=Paenibacillus tarimensis TaxID=416012 RepID=UPI001F1E6F5B|nr:energy-coupling factor transporter ATPase [Paenibacillus tarimensis]MCF2944373.1 energy-coupling factor transporter ATPase [Paenibacillus tarimensis]